jgi:general secretion pathway protein B
MPAQAEAKGPPVAEGARAAGIAATATSAMPAADTTAKNGPTDPASPAAGAARADSVTVSSAPPAGAKIPAAASPPADPKPATPAPPAPVAASHLPLYYELPYELRKDLPALVVSMHVYAEQPAQRFVIVDGDRKAEGDTLKDGIALREIRSDGLVLEFRGQRFFYPRPGR